MGAGIDLVLDGELVVFQAPRLRGEARHKYLDAISGARFDPVTKRHRATVDRLPGILARLRASRLAVHVDVNVISRLAEYEAARWLDREAADERLRLADEQLRMKGEHLRPYQRDGAVWLTMRTNGLLADDPGLGKSLQSLVAIPNDAPVLVVCPALVKGNWARETKKWRPGLRTTIIEGTGNFRWPARGEVVILNFDILPRVHTDDCARKRVERVPAVKCHGCHPVLPREHSSKCPGKPEEVKEVYCQSGAPFEKGCHAYPKPPEGCVVIVDEAHLVKNRRTLRGEATRALAHAVLARRGRVWYLTGTPILNNPEELWAILESADLAHEAFGSWDRFVDVLKGEIKWVERYDPKTGETKRRKAGYSWSTDPGPEAADKLARVMLRRLKKDVLKDLPPKTKRLFPVEIDEQALRECDELLKSVGGRLPEGADELLALQKVHFTLVSRIRSALANAKIPSMVKLVEEAEANGTPLVVFSAHRPPIDLLAKRKGWMTITGDTPSKKRDEIVAAFQEGKTLEGEPALGIAGTIAAMGVGVTLTRASDMLFVDREWTPALNLQAEDRTVRHGQKNAVLVTILVANHMLDERVAEILLGKEEIIASTVDAARDLPRG